MGVEMEKQSAEYWIKYLHLVEHPGEEDGYFSVPFEDTFKVTSVGKEQRSAASIAHFLQKKADKVNGKTIFFRCQSTEMLFYHSGNPMSIYLLPPGAAGVISNLKRTVLGPDLASGQVISYA